MFYYTVKLVNLSSVILFDRNYESLFLEEEVQIETLKNNYLVIFEITSKFDWYDKV